MAYEFNMFKRAPEQVDFPTKHQRLDSTMENSSTYTNLSNLEFCNADEKCSTLPPNKDLHAVQPSFVMDSTTSILPQFGDDAISFPDICCDATSATDYFKDLDLKNLQSYIIPPTQEATISNPLQSAVNNIPKNKSHNLIEIKLSDYISLILKEHNRQFYVYIREFNRNVFTNEEIFTKHRIYMDIHSWYEFQYKLFTFNLKYKSSSFIANNTVLVMNIDNSVMRIKNLKNYSHFDLNENHLEILKDKTYEFNKKLLQHMYTNCLKRLIKQKCRLGYISPEIESALFSKLIMCIENNVLTILNQIYECIGCIFAHESRSLHTCFTFNNREKFNQLGDMILMLVNFEHVVSEFSKAVECISENFLCTIHVENIRNVLFK